jgi:hypothetical protein
MNRKFGRESAEGWVEPSTDPVSDSRKMRDTRVLGVFIMGMIIMPFGS